MADANENAFLTAVAHNCKGYTVAPGCRGEECEYSDGCMAHNCEPHFSWSSCDSCGSTLGGDRENASMIPLDEKPTDDNIIEITICIDCLIFWANGDIPELWEN